MRRKKKKTLLRLCRRPLFFKLRLFSFSSFLFERYRPPAPPLMPTPPPFKPGPRLLAGLCEHKSSCSRQGSFLAWWELRGRFFFFRVGFPFPFKGIVFSLADRTTPLVPLELCPNCLQKQTNARNARSGALKLTKQNAQKSTRATPFLICRRRRDRRRHHLLRIIIQPTATTTTSTSSVSTSPRPSPRRPRSSSGWRTRPLSDAQGPSHRGERKGEKSRRRVSLSRRGEELLERGRRRRCLGRQQWRRRRQRRRRRRPGKNSSNNTSSPPTPRRPPPSLRSARPPRRQKRLRVGRRSSLFPLLLLQIRSSSTTRQPKKTSPSSSRRPAARPRRPGSSPARGPGRPTRVAGTPSGA